jgi:hypothetical protein
MPTLIAGRLDRLLAGALLARARRRWPLLNLLPTSWLHRLLLPAARQVRSSLTRGAVFISLIAVATIAGLVTAS